MPLDTVPWAIKGGAVHSTEVARSLAYAATGGRTGVVDPSDLLVRQTSTAGTSVRVSAGVAAIVNTYAGVTGQSYVARNAGEENIAITATAGTARSDMLVLRIDDPQYGGTAVAPGDIPVGPYAKFAIISNVGSTATSVPSGTPFPCIPLARIDIPANTGTITDAYIKNLRRTIVPQSEAGNVVAMTGSNSRQTINFAKTFLTPPVILTSAGNGEIYWIVGVTTTGFTFEARYPGGGPIGAGPVRIHYHAIEPH